MQTNAGSAMKPGDLVLKLIGQLESKGVACVYLRNHEKLPDEIGNDVDILIPQGGLHQALAVISEGARQNGWKVLRAVRFSPLSVFLASDDSESLIHIDLFDRLEWHFLEYADPGTILRNRRWNGCVHTPDPSDELYLNIATRLIYQGAVREKHRIQTKSLVEKGLQESIRLSFAGHLGSSLGARVADCVISGEWDKVESFKSALRRRTFVRYALCSPMSACRGLSRYVSRSVGRILNPPGPFVVFEGADGVGKSTLIEGILPFFKELTGRTDSLLFHWKPSRLSLRTTGLSAGPSSDPRGRSMRSVPLSLVFLGYHWFGFWVGYFRHILPARIKNRAVIGDRYSYEFFLDPSRLRINLPRWITRIAAFTVPQPNFVICMVASPNAIRSRKPELTTDEIKVYQQQLHKMTIASKKALLLEAHEDATKIVRQARSLILNSLPDMT